MSCWLSRATTLAHFLSFLSLLAAPTTLAKLVNVTIDDQLGDQLNSSNRFAYNPPDLWIASSSVCESCTAKPDPIQMRDSTWQDNTVNPANQTLANATVSFTGTAVYVFCALTDSANSPDGHTDMQFFIDDKSVGNFTHAPADAPGQYLYNRSVFSTDSLSSGLHQLTIQNGRVGGPKSLVLLDYVVYTYEDSPRKHLSGGSIVGITIGALAALVCGVLLVLFCVRRNGLKRNAAASTGAVKPYPGRWLLDGAGNLSGSGANSSTSSTVNLHQMSSLAPQQGVSAGPTPNIRGSRPRHAPPPSVPSTDYTSTSHAGTFSTLPPFGSSVCSAFSTSTSAPSESRANPQSPTIGPPSTPLVGIPEHGPPGLLETNLRAASVRNAGSPLRTEFGISGPPPAYVPINSRRAGQREKGTPRKPSLS